MTEKKQKLEVETAPIELENKKNKYSEFEQEMINVGWNPEGELDAREWFKEGHRIKNKKLDSLFETVDRLKDKLIQQEKDAYARARADLEAKRVEAITQADVEKVKQIEDQTRQLVDPSVMEHANAFIMKHQAWYKGTSYRDQEMQMVCQNRDKELIAERLPVKDHFEKLEKYMEGKYPDYFGIDPVPILNAVEGKQPSSVKSSSRKKITFDDLDDIQKGVASRLQKLGKMTIEEYIKKAVELNTVVKK